MQNFNGSNAYKMRGGSSAPKKKSADRSGVRHGQKKHIKPNMTVRLNKTASPARVKSPERLAEPFRSLDQRQLRLLFGSGLFFAAFLLFFVVTVNFQIRENELAHLIEEQNKTLAELESEHNSLLLDYDSLMSDSAIEAYAMQKLGMQHRDNYQIKWFTLVEEEDAAN
jgi:Cell division protein FtsL.